MKVLQYVLYNYYLIPFGTELIQAFIDLRSGVNIIKPVYNEKLGFWIKKTDIDNQKIDNTVQIIYNMLIAKFYFQDKY